MKPLTELTPADLGSVYSGKPGKCCCGCAGSHRYLAANREQAGKRRGYEVIDYEVWVWNRRANAGQRWADRLAERKVQIF